MQISGWDRFLIRLAPRWGLNRLRARAAADALVRHYDAATPGRRASGWARNFGDADAAIRAALLEARVHARDLVRNNAWARRGQRVIANNTVGWGIVPKAISEDPNVVAKAMARWKAWAETTECESEGRHTFYGIQHLAMKTIAESGEVLLRRRFRRPSDGLSIPMQIQVLEPDFLDQAKTSNTSDAGGPIIQGVEFDLIGRRAAYWLFPQHPGSGRNASASQRIPASEVRHIYYTERPGQSRGISWFVTAILNLKDFDEFEDAELVRQKIAACFAAFVTDADGAGTGVGLDDATNPDPLADTFEPGMIANLPPGRDVKFGTPPVVSDSSFATRTLRRVAAGIGVTYEDMTGDYSQVNFSSARMARLAHWANVHDWRWNMLIPLLCVGVWDWAMEALVMNGDLREAPSATWTPPPMPMVDPAQEGLAYMRNVRAGLMTHDEMVREQGGDPDTHWKEFAEGNARRDQLGIVLDSDPRQVTASGQLQSVSSGNESGTTPTP